MKTTLLITALLVLAANDVHAARRRAVRPALDELAITFVEAGAGSHVEGQSLDAGSVVKQLRQTIGVRIDRRGSGSARTAMVRAYLDGGDGVCRVRIDGVAVGVVPVVIDLQAPIGAVEVHRITIDVPPSAPAGALFCPITWEVSTP